MAINEAFMKKKYKLMPPDGGYGYVILLGASINLVTSTMFYVCFGVIFKDFFVKLGMGTTSISFLTGIRALSLALSGFAAGPLLNLMSRRKLAFIGAVFFNSGAFATVFVDTQAQFFICQGLLQTLGLGFLYNVSCTLINDYFTEKRLLTTSIMSSLAAAAGMVAPVVVSWSMVEYGFRGTLIVISAVAVQSFVGSALIQPVAWHMKKTMYLAEEEEEFIQTSDGDKTLSLARHEKPIDVDSGSAFTEDKTETSSDKIASIRKGIVDCSAIKNYMRARTSYVVSLAMFADILFVYNLAQSLYAENWNDGQVEWSFALIAFGDLATRILFIFSSTWLKLLGNRLIYLIGLLIAVTTKLAMLWVKDYIGTLVILAVMGISRCILVVLLPLVVADSVQPDEFPTAIGITFSMYGVIGIVLGPIIGVIRDRTGSYTIMFIILIAIFSVLTLAWSVETLRHSRRKTEEPVPKRREIRSTSISYN